ncbi:MAG: serine/threonine protein kinase [Myxococcales bacterium]|nr:serine/threonine protein kinase [Myxococcales bacterium]
MEADRAQRGEGERRDRDADGLGARVEDARPEVDPFVARVMAANAARALFGGERVVRVGRYALRRVLGAGGGGSVFVAHDPELDREIAIKLIVAPTPPQRTRALAEGQALARLAHPNVVAVFDVGSVDDRVYLAMELVRGTSLRAYASTASAREVIVAYRQAGEGLVAAHARGLVHGDFKPDNAVIGADGRVRVVDFGLAGAVGADVSGGTPQYMAPELRADTPAAPTHDQYAFAVALGESLRAAGQAPLPRWLAAIVARGSATEVDARFPTMAAMVAALANDPRRRWRRRALIATPLVIGGWPSRSVAAARPWLSRRAMAARGRSRRRGARAAPPRSMRTCAAWARRSRRSRRRRAARPSRCTGATGPAPTTPRAGPRPGARRHG